MKKKFFVLLITILCLFIISGCGKDKDIDNNNDNNNDDNNGSEVENTSSSSTTEDDFKLYTDDTKLVYEEGNTKYIFYFSGDTITAYHTYVDYSDPTTANYAYQVFKNDGVETANKFYVKGKYVVFEWNESEYKDLTASQVKLAYSYMKEVRKAQ